VRDENLVAWERVRCVPMLPGPLSHLRGCSRELVRDPREPTEARDTSDRWEEMVGYSVFLLMDGAAARDDESLRSNLTERAPLALSLSLHANSRCRSNVRRYSKSAWRDKRAISIWAHLSQLAVVHAPPICGCLEGKGCEGVMAAILLFPPTPDAVGGGCFSGKVTLVLLILSLPPIFPLIFLVLPVISVPDDPTEDCLKLLVNGICDDDDGG